MEKTHRIFKTATGWFKKLVQKNSTNGNYSFDCTWQVNFSNVLYNHVSNVQRYGCLGKKVFLGYLQWNMLE
jgi:hypothetical protein